MLSSVKSATIILFVSLIIGGFFLALHVEKSISENAEIQTPPGWKTFTSNACKFAVDYPGDWSVGNQDDMNIMLVSDEDGAASAEALAGGRMFEWAGFTTAVGCQLSLAEFADQNGYSEPNSGDTLEIVLSANEQSVKKIAFHNFEAYEVISGGAGVVDQIVISHKGRIYSFTFPEVSSIDQLDDDKRQILDSFRLTK